MYLSDFLKPSSDIELVKCNKNTLLKRDNISIVNHDQNFN